MSKYFGYRKGLGGVWGFGTFFTHDRLHYRQTCNRPTMMLETKKTQNFDAEV